MGLLDFLFREETKEGIQNPGWFTKEPYWNPPKGPIPQFEVDQKTKNFLEMVCDKGDLDYQTIYKINFLYFRVKVANNGT